MSSLVRVRKLSLSAMFLALGWLLPFVTGQIHAIGNMLCPMHLPVMLCGFILGPIYGLFIGIITPLSRTFLFGMPILYPFSICMALELATYGLLCGLLYKIFKKIFSNVISIYLSLIISIIVGRIVWGVARLFCGIISRNYFTWSLFISGGFLTAWPGIIVQFIVIPLLMKILISSKIINKFN